MPPVRVLYIITTLDIGGTETQLVELLTRLDRRRFDPVVCCLSGGGPLIRTLEAQGIPVEVIGFRGFCFLHHPLRVLHELYRLIRFFRQVRPVIVHGLLFWAYILGTYAARLTGVPLVITGRRSLGFFKAENPYYLFVERVANRMSSLIVANAEAVRADAIRQEGLSAGKTRVVYNGVNLARFPLHTDPRRREDLGLATDGKVIGVVANLIYYKGHRHFLEACRTIKEHEPSFQAVLIGEGPCRPDLEQRVRDLGLDRTVRFLGSRGDVAAILPLVDLAVLPSLSEGFPNAVLEAMAAGRAVVASRVGGIPEVVLDGETGLLVPAGDPAALASAILSLLADPLRAARMGQAGRARVEAMFSLDRMVQETEAVYDELLAGKRRVGRG
jgi:L-malate glycosyltransferase